jgi:hypothetical protein
LLTPDERLAANAIVSFEEIPTIGMATHPLARSQLFRHENDQEATTADRVPLLDLS